MSAGKDSVDSLMVDCARLHAKAGIRPSRSFDALPRGESGDVILDSRKKEEEEEGHDFLSLSAGSSEYTPCGASPM